MLMLSPTWMLTLQFPFIVLFNNNSTEAVIKYYNQIDIYFTHNQTRFHSSFEHNIYYTFYTLPDNTSRTNFPKPGQTVSAKFLSWDTQFASKAG